MSNDKEIIKLQHIHLVEFMHPNIFSSYKYLFSEMENVYGVMVNDSLICLWSN